MIWLWVGIAVLVIVAGALAPVLVGRSNRLRSNDEAIAARSRHSQLGFYVEDPPSTVDEQVAEAFRKARERWETAGSVLATARTEEEFTLAEKIADEGLAQVAEANKRIGRAAPKRRRSRRQ